MEKLDILKHIVDKEAQTIVSKVKSDYNEYKEKDNINKIRDKISMYFKNTDIYVYKDEHLYNIISKCLYHLKVKIFGEDQFGLSSYIKLKQSYYLGKGDTSTWCKGLS